MGDQTWTIMGNQTFSLMGNHTGTINGNCTKSILGMLVETLVAGQNTLCVGPYNRTDIAPSTWLCPSSSQFNSGSWMESKMHKFSCVPVRVTILGIDTTLRQMNIDFTIFKVKTDSICSKIRKLEISTLLSAWLKIAPVDTTTTMMRSQIHATQAEVRAARPAVGVELSTPPSSFPGAQ
jgi:hypothetical protein